MRIGVDATCWANRRGYGRFARELVSAMVSQSTGDVFVCFLDTTSLETFSLDAPNVERVVVSGLSQSPSSAASARSNRGIRDMMRMTNAVRRSHVDVFFSPSVYTWYPLPPGLPAVVTIHDAIPERFPRIVFPSRKTRLFWGLKMKLALFQARRILTVSEYAARDLVRVLGIPRERISVAVEAPSATNRPRAEAAAATGPAAPCRATCRATAAASAPRNSSSRAAGRVTPTAAACPPKRVSIPEHAATAA